MESDAVSIKPPTIDIWKLFIDILKKNYENFLKNPEVQELTTDLGVMTTALGEVDLEKVWATFIEFSEKTLLNLKDLFFNSIKTIVENKIEDNKLEISEKLRLQGKNEEQINFILKRLSDLTDLDDINLINLRSLTNFKGVIQEFILKKLKIIGVTNEEEIAEVLTKLVNNLIETSINDAIVSSPSAAAQAVASLWPFGSEPLVAVNKINDIITQFIQILIDKVMEGAVDAIEEIPTTGGRRKKKRKTKSKHFYINRIRQTLKQFYNY
jgi:hypothetical protein